MARILGNTLKCSKFSIDSKNAIKYGEKVFGF